MRPEDFDISEVNRQYDSALKRHGTHRGDVARIGTIIALAKAGGYQHPLTPQRSHQGQALNLNAFDLLAAVPIYDAAGMPPREFAGPKVGAAQLFPMNALSLFVALGGVGKTTAIVKIAAHIAAGQAWGVEAVKRRKVIIFCIEESKDELNRKYGAAVHYWTDVERQLAEENLRLVSCLDRDSRLTRIVGRQVEGTGLSQLIMDAAKEYEAEVIVLDHLQGFVSGDLNNSDTATAMAREVNHIVSETGAAVVVPAHISKANINATDVLDGFTTGSLAFENAARQVVGVIPMPDDDAKKFGIAAVKSEYMMMGMPKNSYGPSRGKSYMCRVYVPDFHTITVEPFIPPGSAHMRTASERLRDVIVDYVKSNPGTTSNKLDSLSGKDKQFKASKLDLRKAVKELVADGVLVCKSVTKAERVELGLSHQVKEIFEHVD